MEEGWDQNLELFILSGEENFSQTLPMKFAKASSFLKLFSRLVHPLTVLILTAVGTLLTVGCSVN